MNIFESKYAKYVEKGRGYHKTAKKLKVNTSSTEFKHGGKEATGPTRTIYMEALKDTEENVKAGRLKSYNDFTKELKESNEI